VQNANLNVTTFTLHAIPLSGLKSFVQITGRVLAQDILCPTLNHGSGVRIQEETTFFQSLLIIHYK